MEANEVYEVDVNNNSLQILPRLVREFKFDLETSGRTRPPFEDNYFDFVTAIEIIEHLSHGDYLIMEAFRVLRTGGYLLLTTPNLASWINRLLLGFGYQPMFYGAFKVLLDWLTGGIRRKEGSIYGHKNLYTLKAMLDLLKVHGFVTCYVSGSRTFEKGLVGMIDRLLFHFPSVAPILITTAKKIG